MVITIYLPSEIQQYTFCCILKSLDFFPEPCKVSCRHPNMCFYVLECTPLKNTLMFNHRVSESYSDQGNNANHVLALSPSTCVVWYRLFDTLTSVSLVSKYLSQRDIRKIKCVKFLEPYQAQFLVYKVVKNTTLTLVPIWKLLRHLPHM